MLFKRTPLVVALVPGAPIVTGAVDHARFTQLPSSSHRVACMRWKQLWYQLCEQRMYQVCMVFRGCSSTTQNSTNKYTPAYFSKNPESTSLFTRLGIWVHIDNKEIYQSDYSDTSITPAQSARPLPCGLYGYIICGSSNNLQAYTCQLETHADRPVWPSHHRVPPT